MRFEYGICGACGKQVLLIPNPYLAEEDRQSDCFQAEGILSFRLGNYLFVVLEMVLGPHCGPNGESCSGSGEMPI